MWWWKTWAVGIAGILIKISKPYEITRTESLISFDLNEVIVAEVTRFIPLGHHAAIRCAAFEQASHLGDGKAETVWQLIYNRDEVPKWVKLLPNDSKNFRLSVIGNVIYLHGMTTRLDQAVIECSIQGENLTKEGKKLTARTMLVAQDCGGPTIEGRELSRKGRELSMNHLNPCRFGSCRVIGDDGFELLECRCLPQFTGLYCDKLAIGSTYFELLFYSPVFALVAVLLFVACCFRHVEGVKREQPMALEKHIPRGDLSVDMAKYYPAMFITPEQYSELAAGIHLEEVDALPPGSKEWEQPDKKETLHKRRDKSLVTQTSAITAPTQSSKLIDGARDEKKLDKL